LTESNEILKRNSFKVAEVTRTEYESILPATAQKYESNNMNSPYHITISTNIPRSLYAMSNLSVLGSQSVGRFPVPFYCIQKQLAAAAGSCHPLKTQAVEMTQSHNVVLLFLWFHLFHNFLRHFLDLKTAFMATERRFETQLMRQTKPCHDLYLYNLRSPCRALYHNTITSDLLLRTCS
jgi:hypothetical protein